MSLTESHGGRVGVDRGHPEDIKQDSPEDILEADLLPLRIEADWVRSLSPEHYAQEQRKLVMKVDLRLLPPLFVLLVLNYLDRGALAASKVQGLATSLHLKGAQFNTTVSVLYAGYIIGQIPSNLILSRVRPSIYLPAFVTLWGVVSLSTSFVQSYTGLVLARFFLGVTEAPYFPGSVFLLSCWYTKKELATRGAILYAGSLLGNAFGGFVSAGVQAHMDGLRGRESWRWMFLIEGSLTIFAALCAIFILPDYPSNTRWLTSKQKALAIHRLEKDAAGHSDEELATLLGSLRSVVVDYRVWFFFAITHFKTVGQGVNQFLPTVIATFGGTRVHTLLLTAPPYLVAIVTSLACSISSDRRPERFWHIVVPWMVAMIGFIIAVASPNHAARYIALFLCIGGIYAPYNVVLSWVASTFPRPRAKRAAAIAIVNVSGNIADIWSPYMYQTQFSPGFRIAFEVSIVLLAVAITLCYALRCLLHRSNKALAVATEREAQANALGIEKPIIYVL